MIGAGMIRSIPVEAALPNSAEPITFPEDAAPETSIAELATAKNAAHHYPRFEDTSLPLAFHKHGAAVDGLRTERFFLEKLTWTQDSQRSLLTVQAEAKGFKLSSPRAACQSNVRGSANGGTQR